MASSNTTTRELWHPSIRDRLWEFLQSGNVPNLLFHGPHGSGKQTLVQDFLKMVYGNESPSKWKSHVLLANCAHGKGIRFIREEVKFFAKTHIHSDNGSLFKTIVLMNADKLTVDAQSALRRCIELFSHNTRFILVASKSDSLMKPILSRFCEILVPSVGTTATAEACSDTIPAVRLDQLKRQLTRLSKETNPAALTRGCEELHERAFCGMDILQLVAEDRWPVRDLLRKHEWLLVWNSMRKEFRSEPLLMFCMLQQLFHPSDDVSITATLESYCF